MEIRPTMTSPMYTGSTNAASVAPAAAENNAPSEVFTSSSNAPVSLIIQHEDASKLDELRKSILAQNPNNHITAELPLIGGFAVEVTPDANGVLPNLSNAVGEGGSVFLDQAIGIPEGEMKEMEDTFKPLMDNANVTLGVDTLHEKGITGKGTCICVIDTGIAPHPDVKDRIIGFKDMINDRTEPYDDQGHGTHCAGIVAGDGTSSEGKFKGVAPEAKLVGVKVLGANGSGSFSGIIKGIQWAVENKEKYDIDVISMSLGGYVQKSYKDDPVCQAVEAAIAAGVTTVIAAGNEGPSAGTIGTPGNAPNALTIGAMDDKGTVDRSDDTIARFSSRGNTRIDHLDKPDIIAPGVNITSLSNKGNGYVSMSGTSMATPFAAGVAALMHQVKPGISPAQCKSLLMKTADKLTPPEGPTIGGTPKQGYGIDHQGAGVIDPVESVEYLLSQRPGGKI